MKQLSSFLTLTIALVFVLAGCDGPLTGPDSTAEDESIASESDARPSPRGVPKNGLEIKAVHENDVHRFELSDDEIPSGWTTIELDNQTEATHFAFLRKASSEFLTGMRRDFGEISTEAYLKAISIPFQEAWNPYYRHEIRFSTFLENLGERTPDWFSKHRPLGGPGLTSGGQTSWTTQNLEPGTYFIECYVLNDEGVFHVTEGMIEKLEVTQKSSGASEPEPTMHISLDDDGIEVESGQGPSAIQSGRHTVAVTFEENGTPSGHDLHLIRLDDGTTVLEVNNWMDWPDVGLKGFYNTDIFGPALTSTDDKPGPQTWMGGVQDIQPPLSSPVPEPLATAYFHVKLTPGEYAWVSEIANPQARGFLETFTVSSGTKASR